MSARRVLLVDDHADSCDLFQIALEQAGYQVDCAYDGLEGLARVTTGAYDVAIMDIGLPGIDGFELAKRARAALGDRTPPLFAITGYAPEANQERMNESGFTKYLVKPVDVHTLVEAVRAA